MSTKRFIAPTMREALRLVRLSFGPDAVILSNNLHEKGVEVIASSSTLNSEKNSIVLNSDQSSKVITKPLQAHNMTARILLGATEARAKARTAQNPVVINTEEQEQPRKKPHQLPPQEEWIAEGQVLHEVRNELQSIRDFLSAQLSGLAWQEFKRMKPMQVSLLRRMLSLGIESNTAMYLLQKVEEDADLQIAWSEALSILSDNLLLEPLDFFSMDAPITVVGNAGAGKTLTLVKIAAALKVKRPEAKILFLSTASEGVASNALLRGCSRLLRAPVILVSTVQEYQQALRLHEQNQFIFIDTPPLTYGIQEQYFPWINMQKKPKTLVILPASQQYEVLKNTIDKSSTLFPTGSIMTKTDETSSLGEIMSILINSKIPLVFYTDGIKIPANLQVPSLAKLMEKLVAGQSTITSPAELAWMRQGGKISV